MSADPAFLANFGFTPSQALDLNRLLHEAHGFIAGGAALFWFLGVESPADQDLDIWIPSRCKRGPDHENRHLPLTTLPDGRPDLACYAYDRALADRVTAFMESCGLVWHPEGGLRHTAEGFGSPTDIPYHTNPEFQRVVKVIHDFRPRGGPRSGKRKIQVIYYYGDTRPLDGFDLDVCKIAVTPVGDSGEFQFQLPAELVETEVRARRMRVTNTSCRPNLARRLVKYYTRGFVLVTAEGRELTREEAFDTYDPHT